MAYKLTIIFWYIGFPRIFHTNNGKEFTTRLIVDFLTENNPSPTTVAGCPQKPSDQKSCLLPSMRPLQGPGSWMYNPTEANASPGKDKEKSFNESKHSNITLKQAYHHKYSRITCGKKKFKCRGVCAKACGCVTLGQQCYCANQQNQVWWNKGSRGKTNKKVTEQLTQQILKNRAAISVFHRLEVHIP